MDAVQQAKRERGLRGCRRVRRPPARQRRARRPRQDASRSGSCSPRSPVEGHVLFEDVPGTAKTVLARALAGSDRGRGDEPHPVHARPAADRRHGAVDLEPRAARSSSSRPGRCSRNVLARRRDQPGAPEGAVGAARGDGRAPGDGRRRRRMPCPTRSSLLATENTIEQEGTFPLPEAQLDRFLVRTSLGYPTVDEEIAIVDAQLHGHPLDGLQPVVGLDELAGVFAAVEEVYIDPLLKRWAVELVRATRELEIVEVGASVRGSLALERVARAWALVNGREFVVADDIERALLAGRRSPPRPRAGRAHGRGTGATPRSTPTSSRHVSSELHAPSRTGRRRRRPRTHERRARPTVPARPPAPVRGRAVRRVAEPAPGAGGRDRRDTRVPAR